MLDPTEPPDDHLKEQPLPPVSLAATDGASVRLDELALERL